MTNTMKKTEDLTLGVKFFSIKLAFIVGSNDNQSSNAKAWLIVKGDGKVLYEELVSQTDLAKQVVLDVEGVNMLSFHSIYDSGDFLKGQINFGVVDITVYPEGDNSVPELESPISRRKGYRNFRMHAN